MFLRPAPLPSPPLPVVPCHGAPACGVGSTWHVCREVRPPTPAAPPDPLQEPLAQAATGAGPPPSQAASLAALQDAGPEAAIAAAEAARMK